MSFNDRPDGPRRRFVQGLALGGVATGLGLLQPRAARASGGPRHTAALDGTDFSLEVAQTPVNYTGRARLATTLNGSVPGPLLHWREGSTVRLAVTNRLSVPTSIHWHGIVLPFEMDGVPGISFDGIAPGETFTYRFQVRQAGTYWYHAHSAFQEQTGLYGPLVITPAGGERHAVERDYVVLLSDWADEEPERVYARLKKQSDYYNYARPTVGDFLRDARDAGIRDALSKRRMWNRMRMNPTDLSDVGAATYTYLMNGTAPAGNWTALFQPGERVRLRIINGSASTLFDVRIPGLQMLVVAADGQDIEPVAVDEFRISVAETYDVIVQPTDARAYTLFAQTIDRAGYARGTLAPRPGMQAAVPSPDPRVWLGMQDMGMAMAMPAASPDMAAMDMPGMDMGDMPAPAAKEHPAMAMDHSAMDHSTTGPSSVAMAPSVPVRHAPTEHGPGTEMRVAHPRTNLDDPGVGLRDNGRRVLTYADLRSVDGPLDPREPERTLELHLTGNMERYMWSFDGVRFSDAGSLRMRLGERLRIVLVNDTMMNHPIHLHGMFSELEDADGRFLARKHTVNVQPGQRVSYRVNVDNPGRWAYHCHLLFHMEAGMFREVVVA